MIKSIIDNVLKDKEIVDLNLSKDVIKKLISKYENYALDSLIDRGYLDLGDGSYLEIVQLTERVHVLRGIPYKGTRKFKLKLTAGDEVYKKIENYYEKLKEDIL